MKKSAQEAGADPASFAFSALRVQELCKICMLKLRFVGYLLALLACGWGSVLFLPTEPNQVVLLRFFRLYWGHWINKLALTLGDPQPSQIYCEQRLRNFDVAGSI